MVEYIGGGLDLKLQMASSRMCSVKDAQHQLQLQVRARLISSTNLCGKVCLLVSGQTMTKREQQIQMEAHFHYFLSPSDIQEFYEVTLLDSQRWAESSKTPDAVTAVTLWDFSSLQSTAVTSDTLPSLSTSIEVNCMSCGRPSSASERNA